jgi:polar amino acid transport system substrate-binding protein
MAVACLLAGTASATETTTPLRFTTLEWPPHVEADGSGVTSEVIRTAFAQSGHPVIIEVHPWNEAIRLAAEIPGYAGVFPEYYSVSADAEAGGHRCLFSTSLGSSPVGFAERRDSPLEWMTLPDLEAYRIGTVRGYNNEAMFDLLVATGKIHTVVSASDEQNLLRLAEGRVSAAVIDQKVFEHLLANSQDLQEVAGELQFNNRLLANPEFHICFQNSDYGRKARDTFEKAKCQTGHCAPSR